MLERHNTILSVSAGVCVLFILATFYVNSSIKKTQSIFDGKKAELVKESQELNGRLDSIQDTLNARAEEISSLEIEKKAVSDKLETLRKESERAVSSFRGEIDTLKKKNSELRKKISEIEKSPVIKRIKDYIERERNSAVKKILEETAARIERVQAEKEGRAVNLEPIVVATKDEALLQPAAPAIADASARKGAVLSIDRKNNLVVVSLGRKDDLKEGSRIKIFKKDIHVASAEVINVRYRIAAAAIDDIGYKYKITDIKEGDPVVPVDM